MDIKQPMHLWTEWWKGGAGQGKGRGVRNDKVLTSAIWWMVPFRETRNIEALESGRGMK